jgi:hypothetical protein
MTTQDDEKEATVPSTNDDTDHSRDTLSPLPANTASPGPGVIQFRPTRDHGQARASDGHHAMFREPHTRDNTSELMGPLLRRKKVVSMPLGQGGDFFVSPDAGGPHHQLFTQEVATGPGQYHRHHLVKQKSQGFTPDGPLLTAASLAEEMEEIPTLVPKRKKQDSKGNPIVKGILRRKQVSLDLLGPNDFFATEDESIIPMPPTPEEEEEEVAEAKLFRPLRFAPRLIRRPGGGGAHGKSGHGSAHDEAPEAGGLATVDEETVEAFNRYSSTNKELKLQIMSLKHKVESEEGGDSKTREEVLEASDQMIKTHLSLKEDEQFLKSKLNIEPLPLAEDSPVDKDGTATVDSESHYKDFDDSGIIRATRNDKIKCGILVCIMMFLTLAVSLWDTESNEEGYLFGPVGLACVTPCEGNLETRDFFNGHSKFSSGEVIELIMNLDQYPTDSDVHATVEIVGVDSRMVKATKLFGPPDDEDRSVLDERVTVNFDDPHEDHIINVNSTISGIDLSFTLEARVLSPLAEHSVIIAALIMICVYVFILIEVIHRTLVALFGSMIALMFLFIMQKGETETIRQIMLNLEWSTLGLLFGMMLIVGELSHTGIFEWCAVRLLMASKGSFSRLMILLCTLTAVASAFLDNVTTMLLVAPVTIDMCTILGVDPRPYLIGEVILSNIGGTATLIGESSDWNGCYQHHVFHAGCSHSLLPSHFSTDRRPAQYHHRKFVRGDWLCGFCYRCLAVHLSLLRPCVTFRCPLYLSLLPHFHKDVCPRYRKAQEDVSNLR